MSASGSLHFSKMHGLGNDFVVVDATVQAFTPDAAQLQWLCDRHRGVKAWTVASTTTKSLPSPCILEK